MTRREWLLTWGWAIPLVLIGLALRLENSPASMAVLLTVCVGVWLQTCERIESVE